MIRKKIIVRGRVQGIGYRPFVAEKAEELNIRGWVRNIAGVVEILAEGASSQIVLFEEALVNEAPFGSIVTSIESEYSEEVHSEGKGELFSDFKIVQSEAEGNITLPLIPADLPTCSRCNRQLHDSNDRRFLHPFISCTACGPRYSIINAIPYDRDTITMEDFDLCPDCCKEYTEQGNIRRHAQTIACRKCGPRLSFLRLPLNNQEKIVKIENQDNSCMEAAVELLKQGGILALKDIGGFHLVADPFREETVAALRQIKGRERKPFAVCFPDVKAVKDYCHISSQEEELLNLSARPIVLLRRKEGQKSLNSLVCMSSPDIGAMLPCNPVQIMLTEALGPLIMTSANLSGEQITIDNDKMQEWMKAASGRYGLEVGLGILSHNRRIVTPLDDSILRLVNGRRQTLRRARGFVPDPVPFPNDRQIFAAGGDLKACFCYTGDQKAYLSQHFGDLMEESCFDTYRQEIERMKNIFGFSPDRSVCDNHPGYVSASFGLEVQGSEVQRFTVQHHRAHVASVMAEHNIRKPVLGFAFDGTGYGDDGTIWGGEVFYYDGLKKLSSGLERVAHLEPVKLIGGDEGAKNTDTILQGYLKQLGMEKAFEEQGFFRGKELIGRALELGINTVMSSSMGRLFDAVSALLNICHYNSYEGEAAIELENLAAEADKAYKLSFQLITGEDGSCWISAQSLFEGIGRAITENVSGCEIARGFIYAIADVIVDIAELFADKNTAIVLSGGTFLNRILLERVEGLLGEKGYLVYRNEQVPPGDGGLCLGQAYLCSEDSH